jgi:hypothetical protein
VYSKSQPRIVKMAQDKMSKMPDEETLLHCPSQEYLIPAFLDELVLFGNLVLNYDIVVNSPSPSYPRPCNRKQKTQKFTALLTSRIILKKNLQMTHLIQ